MTADGPCRIFLVGMMGTGKSTIGRLLSEATGWPYLDNDELLERVSGRTARQLLSDGGEPALRAAESSALAMAAEAPPPAVIGVAAGTILDPVNRDRLRDSGIVVWLSADPAVLAVRSTGSEHRPWLEGDAEAWLRDAAKERNPLYRSVADITIDSGLVRPVAAARTIRAGIERAGRDA